jgi:hypothetical protein
MNFVILEFSKTKHNLYNNLDYLGLNPYEQRHFCFHGGMGDPGGGEGSEAEGTGGGVDPGGVAGSKDGLDIDSLSTDPEGMTADEAEAEAAAMDIAANIDAYRDALQNFGPISDPLGLSMDPDFLSIDPYPSKKLRRIEEIPRKMYTSPLLQDPVRMLPKMDKLVDRETASELGRDYLTMLTKAGVEAKAEGREGLVEDIQEELDKGLLADYYQNYDLMNTLENVGYKTFGTGYRGRFEARTGTNLRSLTRDEYGSGPLGRVDTSERGANLAMFQQFALENPNMTAMEAMEAFNAQYGPTGAVSPVDLGLMGYDPNAPAGPQAQSREDENYRGLLQGLGLVAKGVAFGPAAAFSDLMLSGKTGEPTSPLGILGKELDKQTGIPSAVESAFDQFTTDLGKARDTVVDAVQENIVDPITGFFSPEPEAPAQTPDYTGAEMAFFDPVDIGNPYAGLSTPEFEAQMAFEEYQRGIDFDKERDIPGLEVDVQQVPGSFDNMISSLPPSSPEDDALADAYNFAALSPLSPEQDPDFKKGSFFEGLDPKETQDYIDRVAFPEGVKLVRKRRAQVEPPPTVSEQVSAPRTGNFFPGSFDRRTATPRTRTQTLADIYGLSEEDANRMLGIA